MKLFVHMPKCAGTSVLNLLEASVSNNLIKDYDSCFKIPFEPREQKINEFLNTNNTVANEKIVYGHFFPIKYLANSIENTTLVTILRDPIARLQSHYKYWNSGDFSDHYLWRKMKQENWTFEDFALSSEMQNIYAQHFTRINLNDFSFIGVYENLDYSVKLCFEALEIPLNIEIPRLNISETKIDINLNNDLVNQIKKFHSDDYEIYNYALNNFNHTKQKSSCLNKIISFFKIN